MHNTLLLKLQLSAIPEMSTANSVILLLLGRKLLQCKIKRETFCHRAEHCACNCTRYEQGWLSADLTTSGWMTSWSPDERAAAMLTVAIVNCSAHTGTGCAARSQLATLPAASCLDLWSDLRCSVSGTCFDESRYKRAVMEVQARVMHTGRPSATVESLHRFSYML